jgi:hypothetical protein
MSTNKKRSFFWLIPGGLLLLIGVVDLAQGAIPADCWKLIGIGGILFLFALVNILRN